ncbi:MAG TPA: hypothetical protein VNT01_05710 [Symbiobacteriaceae bacterium]|nr:hypothetical protein [Symbiobacteriaceae bacterium]
MHWWEEAEARAHRARTAASMAQSLFQRLQSAGVDPDLAFGPAYDLGRLHDLCTEFIQLVESLLEVADGDRDALRRHGLVLLRWVRYAYAWTAASAAGFNQLIDSLQLDAEDLAEREQLPPAAEAAPPEEQPKVEGRYQRWHLLYERLDLKLTACGVEEQTSHGLARSLARVYEQCLITTRRTAGLEKEASPRFRAVARLLLDLNTSWHFDLGPYHLSQGELRPRGSAPRSLQTWLLLAFG